MILDLFAGPGGWDVALDQLGLHGIGIEWDAAACKTRAAAGHLTIRGDVSNYPTEPFVGRVTGLIASPPCQDFSRAGTRAGIDGYRGRHVYEVMRWATALRPDWIACEQVPQVLPIWKDFALALNDLGYLTWTGILNAADYGVPQIRQRAILMAHKQDGFVLTVPRATHSDSSSMDLFSDDLLPYVTMAKALGWPAGRVGFPRVDDTGTSPDGYRERDWTDVDLPAKTVTEKIRSWTRQEDECEGSKEHELLETESGEATKAPTMLNTGRDWKPGGTRDDAQKISVDEPSPTVTGQTKAWWWQDPPLLNPGMTATQPNRRLYDPMAEPAPTIAFGHDAANWRWEERRNDQSGSGEVDPAWPWDRPATTVAGRGLVPDPGMNANSTNGAKKSRNDGWRVTHREAGILQSFDPEYPWRGKSTKIYQQIGNAIPPKLAKAIIEALI